MYSLRLTTSASGCCERAESEMLLPILKGQLKMRAKANWNLFVSFCGVRRKISPVNINQVNNIRLETLICFLAIFVTRIPSLVRYDDIQLSIDDAFRFPSAFFLQGTSQNGVPLFPSVFIVVHYVFPQFQIFQVYTGTLGYTAYGVLDSLDSQAGSVR